MFGSPVFLILLWTAVSAFVWLYHRLQEVTSLSDVSVLPKWARFVAQELEREISGFHRPPRKIWRQSLIVVFVAVLLFYLVVDYTATVPIRFGTGLLCALALGAWAYYLDKRMI